MNKKWHKHAADMEQYQKLMTKANGLYKQGKYDEALEAYKRFLEFIERTFDPSPPKRAREIAECLTIILGLYVKTGRDGSEESDSYLLRFLKMGMPPES